MRTGRPFLLTEHGIYTRERRIDIAQADWIYSEAKDTPVVTHRTNEFFKEWWMTLFSFLSRLAYERADEIVSLYEGNRRQQVIEGAPAHKTRVISNGIVFDPHAVSSRHAPRGKNIGLMGRVVPIKDIKTFIDICRELIRTDDEYRFFVMGPLDEDPAYFDECREIVALCGLDDRLTFTGKVRADEWYPKLDLLVLTSISEGQPLVILEGYAHGLPCAATDVGACREMICGSTRDDRLLGASGEIIPLREPTESARIIHALMSDHERYARCSHAATERLRAYYHADEMFAAYRKRYAFLTEVC
jgi:glycosyltransferase involved in cell wall biosynthesis